MKVSIVIPTKNEGKTIGEVIDKVRPYGDDVVVVDSKNTKDDTREVAESKGARVLVDNGVGKGDGIRVAIKTLDSDVLVFIDADGSHIPEDIPKVVAPIKEGKADMVIASRMLGGSEELYGTIFEAIRLFANVAITLIINYRWNVRITDSQNGFRAIKTSVAKDLDLKADIFDIETEMLMKCLKKGYCVGEVPSRELSRRHGKSGINIVTMGPRYLWRVLVNLF